MSNRLTEPEPGELPAFGQAKLGTLLDDLDRLRADQEAAAETRNAARWAEASARALARLRGEPGSGGDDLRAQHLEDRADCDAQREARDREHLAKLQSGEWQPIATWRLGGDQRTGVYASRVRRRGGEWSRPRVVAVGRRSTAAVSVRSREPRGTVRRPRARRRTTRARAPSRDSSGGGEPGPGPNDGPGDDFTETDARYAAAHVAAVYPRGLTPARFRATVAPFLFGLEPEQRNAAQLQTFIALPGSIQRTYYWHLRRAPNQKGGTS